MFAKPYKLKSNNTLKNSEKKSLAQRVLEEFNLPSEEKVKDIIPQKGTCICMKLVLHSGDYVNLYAVDGVPMIIETAEGLVPTVCALWKVPGLVPTLTIHSPVLAKIQNGAPLYLPGVTLPPSGLGFPLFPAGTVLAARTVDNDAVCVIGRATMSSADMLLRTTGVCMDILQVYGDLLSKDNKLVKVERPKVTPTQRPDNSHFSNNIAEGLQQISLQAVKEEWPSLGPPPATSVATPPVANEPATIPDTPDTGHTETTNDIGDNDENVNTGSSDTTVEEIPSDMDGLLRWCLLGFIKLHGKTVELPLKTNLLYKKYLHPLCPSDRTLDVKKSTYKKLGKFLDAMQLENLVEVRELEKGVSSVTAVNLAHPSVRAHRAVAPAPAPAAPTPGGDYRPPAVREMLCVTAAVQELLAPNKKGTPLTAGEVRSLLTQYVAARGLTAAAARGAVTLDTLLARVLGKREKEDIKWDQLMSGVTSRMTAATEMRFADGASTLNKAKLEPVRMDIVTRSGNKKVTLVSNLEQFGFNLVQLAAAWQRGAAGACGVTRAPGARHDQVMLQGDQTHFVAKLLIEKYGLPKKFVEGADKALNKKK